MSYKVLYRSYRPKTFNEIIGQKYVVKTLLNSIKSSQIGHSYLFVGPRGTGKTSIAKLFARAINCTNFVDDVCNNCKSCTSSLNETNMDIIELDAASNNSVENIRNLIESVKYPPLNGKYKVYIIDEVHMLSSSAFNAFLKTLEEPPSYCVFILATTEPHKILSTILSRCQRYNFKKLTNNEIVERLKYILKKENLLYDNNALLTLARLSDGAMRDCLSNVELVRAYNPKGIYQKDVETIFSLVSSDTILSLISNIFTNKQVALKLFRDLVKDGANLQQLISDIFIVIKEALIYQTIDSSLLEVLTVSEVETLLEQVDETKLLLLEKKLEAILISTSNNQEIENFIELLIIEIGCTLENKIEEDKTYKEEISVNDDKQEETPIIKNNNETILNNDLSNEDYVHILLTCTKAKREIDQIIFNKLELYKTSDKYSRVYDHLSQCSLFGSSKDVLIILSNDNNAYFLNTDEINKSIYNFMYNEFGVDKSIVFVDDVRRSKIIELFKNIQNKKIINRKIKLNKFTPTQLKSVDEKLKELFD